MSKDLIINEPRDTDACLFDEATFNHHGLLDKYSFSLDFSYGKGLVSGNRKLYSPNYNTKLVSISNLESKILGLDHIIRLNSRDQIRVYGENQAFTSLVDTNSFNLETGEACGAKGCQKVGQISTFLNSFHAGHSRLYTKGEANNQIIYHASAKKEVEALVSAKSICNKISKINNVLECFAEPECKKISKKNYKCSQLVVAKNNFLESFLLP